MNPPSNSTPPALRWQITPGWENVLIGPSGPMISQWLQNGDAHVVKHGAHRTVYRVDLPERTLFVKHYRCQPWFGVWRHVLRASHSRREWRKALEVARRRIPSVPPVAVGEVQQGPLIRDNYYVSEGIPGAQALDVYVRDVLPALEPRERSRRRRQIIEALARLVALAHTSGIDHNDLHTGNVLVRWPQDEATPAPELYLIDLPGIRLTGPLNWRRSRDSLAMLGGSCLFRVSRIDRWRFWKMYVSERREALAVFPDDASQEIWQRMQAHAERVVAARDKRCLRNNRDFQRITTPAAIAHAVKEFPADALQAIAAEPGRLLRTFRHEPVKIGHASLLVQGRLSLAGQSMMVAYKRSRVRSWKRCLAPLRRSRALASWRTGHALLARGIATPRPLAAIQPTGILHSDSYLITAWVPGALNLHLYGWELAGRAAHDRDRRAAQAAESLGRLLGRMHAWHVSHRDLKGCNLIVVEASDRVEAYLVDLDSVHFHRRISRARQARDLARLAVSMQAHAWLTRTIRLRFLRAYFQELGLERAEWKPLWRAISHHAQLILARFQRDGRPVA